MERAWREELAWAAGFFDGEGWSGTILNKNQGRRYARMSLHQVHVAPLHRFQEAVVGLGSVKGPYDHSKGKNQPIYQWVASNYQAVQAVGVMLWPFLGTVKQEQWTNAMLASDWTRPVGDLAVNCARGHSIAQFRTKWGQCRECMRIQANDRRAAKRAVA